MIISLCMMIPIREKALVYGNILKVLLASLRYKGVVAHYNTMYKMISSLSCSYNVESIMTDCTSHVLPWSLPPGKQSVLLLVNKVA